MTRHYCCLKKIEAVNKDNTNGRSSRVKSDQTFTRETISTTQKPPMHKFRSKQCSVYTKSEKNETCHQAVRKSLNLGNYLTMTVHFTSQKSLENTKINVYSKVWWQPKFL